MKLRVVDETLVSAPDARAFFLLGRQKKEAKEKATPGRRPAFGGVPCATRTAGRLRNSGLALLRQSSPTAPGPSPLLGASHWDPKGVAALPVRKYPACCGRPRKKGKNQIATSLQPPLSFRAPWKVPSNAGLLGAFGWRCLSRRRV